MNRTFLISVKPNKRNPENKRSGSPNKILMLFGMSLTVCLLFTLRFDDLESRRRLKLEEDTKPVDTSQVSTSQAEASKPDGIDLEEWAEMLTNFKALQDGYFGKVQYKYRLTADDMNATWTNLSFQSKGVARTVVTDGLTFDDLHAGREVDVEANWADAMEENMLATEAGVNRGFWNTNEWDSTSGTFEIIGMFMMVSAFAFTCFNACKKEDGFSKRLCCYLFEGKEYLEDIEKVLREKKKAMEFDNVKAATTLFVEQATAATAERPELGMNFKSNSIPERGGTMRSSFSASGMQLRR